MIDTPCDDSLVSPAHTHLVLIVLVGRVSDFYTGVTLADMSDPTPGNCTLCTGRFDGELRGTTVVTCDAGVIGRYVWIQFAGRSDIKLYEVEVYAGWLHVRVYRTHGKLSYFYFPVSSIKITCHS